MRTMIEGWDDDDEDETHKERELANERSNEHIEEYLARYMNDPNAPGHALMISGSWGIGKSHFVRQLVNKYAKSDNQQQYVYVSLSGLRTISDIDTALSVALFPFLGTPTAKAAMKTAQTAMKFFRVDPDLRMHSIVNKVNAKLYVFDDLERCEVPIQTTLGYINKFVELEGRKVVIVAHETELDAKQPEYRGIKEKLVGQTFSFQPVIRLPLKQFIQSCGSEIARGILNNHADLILTRYAQSELNNLRVLRQTVWDFARLLDQLTEEQRNNSGLITSLVDTLIPLSFEYKAGRIRPDDIVEYNPYGEYLVPGEKRKETVWGRFRKRYPNNKLHDNIFSTSVLADMLVHGYFDQAGLRKACDESFYCGRIGDVASWRRVWNAFDEKDADLDELIADMEDRFLRREYVVPGEIFHVLGLRVWLSKNKLITSSIEQIVPEFKKYVDDLYTAGSIATSNPNGDDTRTQGYGGLGVRDTDKPEFKAAAAYYLSRRDQFIESQRPDEAKLLLAELRSSPRSFISKICFTNDGSYQYRDIPILMHMDASECAKALAELDSRDQQAVFSSIRERYDQGSLQGNLSDERDWIVKLRECLIEIVASRSGFGKFRLERMIEWSIDPLLKAPFAEQSGDDDDEEPVQMYD